MIKATGFLFLSMTLLIASASRASTIEAAEARAALSETIREGHLAWADHEIMPPVFAPAPVPVEKVESPKVMQLSESSVDIETDDEEFVVDEE